MGKRIVKPTTEAMGFRNTRRVDIMKKFEVGKTYGAYNHSMTQTVERRTECFVWINGIKKRVDHRDIDGELVEVVRYAEKSIFAECER